ncbi:MAG TPA: hypothetical protein VHS06_03850 [Chloroflexota bacterium]|nr:hypothetical protein [Chloroflexota bacterium]
MARITPEGVSHISKTIAWAEIDEVKIMVNELGGNTTDVWVKSKGFTGTIHPSMQDVERAKALITQNVASERISYDEFTPSYLALKRVRDVFIKVVWVALVGLVAYYILRYRPSATGLFKSATDTATSLGPLSVLVTLLGVHQLMFIKECWAPMYRIWRFRYLRTDPPERVAFDHGVILTVAGASALLLALAAGEWHGLALGIVGLALLVAVKRCSSDGLRGWLAVLTLILLSVAILVQRATDAPFF